MPKLDEITLFVIIVPKKTKKIRAHKKGKLIKQYKKCTNLE